MQQQPTYQATPMATQDYDENGKAIDYSAPVDPCQSYIQMVMQCFKSNQSEINLCQNVMNDMTSCQSNKTSEMGNPMNQL